MTRLALALALLATPVVAADTPRQIVCGPLPVISQLLLARHGEQVAARGVLSTGTQLVVIWANPDTKTWTAATVGADGTACLIWSGSGWEVAEVKRGEHGL